MSRKFSGDQIFGDLQATYGRRDAGRIVKWAFYMGGPHRGRRTDGTPITFSSFALGCRWLTDVWHLEAQQRIAQEKTASAAGASYGGFATLADPLMTFDPRTAYLSDDEAARLYVRHPGLAGPTSTTVRRATRQGRTSGGESNKRAIVSFSYNFAKIYFAAGIGLTYQRLDWGDFQGPTRWWRGGQIHREPPELHLPRVGLFFTGPFGIGKSMLATLALKEFVKLGYRCYATTFAQTIEAFTSTWGRDGKANQEFFQDKFLYSEVLLLDDPGGN